MVEADVETYVSIPLRYADNTGSAVAVIPRHLVSIPLRYADNTVKARPLEVKGKVSIPLRYADNRGSTFLKPW